MFWGLNLKPNRKYTQTTTKSFHISGAALDGESSTGGPTQIFISSENQKFLVCTLRKGGPEQVMLDLNFEVGEEICFQSIGSGNVSLAGYIIDKMMSDSESEDDEYVSHQNDVDLRNALNKKKKQMSKQLLDENEGEDESEDDPDFNGTAGDDSDAELSGDEEDGDEDDEDEDEEGDDSDDEEEDDDAIEEEEEIQSPKAKQPKLEKQAKQNGNVATTKAEKKDKKKKDAQPQAQQQQKQKKDVGVERTITGGVKVVDLREGSGPEAKVGKRAQVYYEGRLKSNNKVFDSMKSGAGFKFPVGRGEVIKAWDVGVVGMKVGGKRRIICPPHMAYGVRGSPPTIPPNSTLVFEVELKGVN